MILTNYLYPKLYIGSTVEFFTHEDVLTGLLFQDHLMKSIYSAFPEVLLVDATYKLTDMRMPVYIMIAIDGNGQGEIVRICLTALENECAITAMVQTFKRNNPSWNKIKVVMNDKDFTESVVFWKELAQAALHICIFHTMCSLSREVTTEKLSILPEEKDHVLELITRLTYAKSESEYDSLYQDLLKTCLNTVIEYYNW